MSGQRTEPSAEQIRRVLTERLPHYLEIFERMVAINSFTASPDGVNRCGAVTAEIFRPLGFSAEKVQARDPQYGKHLILHRPGKGGGTIAFVSHLDTVFTEEEERKNGFHWRVEGDRIYGPGTIDIKGGTIVGYMVLDALKQLVPDVYEKHGWQFFLDAAEERFADDFPDVCLTRFPKDTLACLVFEAGRFDNGVFKIVTRRKGRATFLVEAEGRSAHAGVKHDRGANAIRLLAQAIEKIESLTDYERYLTFNVGLVSGGEGINRIPAYACASVEMRAFDTDVFDEGVARIKAVGELSTVRAKSDGFAATLRVEKSDQSPPWPHNPGTEKLFAFWDEAARELGYRVEAESRGGLSDGNRVWHRVPTIDGLGPSGDNDHCSERTPDRSKDQEYVEVGSLVPKALLNTTAILKLLSSA